MPLLHLSTVELSDQGGVAKRHLYTHPVHYYPTRTQRTEQAGPAGHLQQGQLDPFGGDWGGARRVLLGKLGLKLETQCERQTFFTPHEVNTTGKLKQSFYPQNNPPSWKPSFWAAGLSGNTFLCPPLLSFRRGGSVKGNKGQGEMYKSSPAMQLSLSTGRFKSSSTSQPKANSTLPQLINELFW